MGSEGSCAPTPPAAAPWSARRSGPGLSGHSWSVAPRGTVPGPGLSPGSVLFPGLVTPGLTSSLSPRPSPLYSTKGQDGAGRSHHEKARMGAGPRGDPPYRHEAGSQQGPQGRGDRNSVGPVSCRRGVSTGRAWGQGLRAKGTAERDQPAVSAVGPQGGLLGRDGPRASARNIGSELDSAP